MLFKFCFTSVLLEQIPTQAVFLNTFFWKNACKFMQMNDWEYHPREVTIIVVFLLFIHYNICLMVRRFVWLNKIHLWSGVETATSWQEVIRRCRVEKGFLKRGEEKNHRVFWREAIKRGVSFFLFSLSNVQNSTTNLESWVLHWDRVLVNSLHSFERVASWGNRIPSGCGPHDLTTA